MTETIYEQLQHEWHNPLPSAPATPVEDTMSLATFEDDMKADLQHLEEAVTTGIRSFAAKHLPAVAEAASLADQAAQSRIVQTALDVVVGPEDEELAIAFLKRLDKGAQALVTDLHITPETPSGIDAQPDPAGVPADGQVPAEAAPAAAGPQVGGVA